ncbi:uncharacterized protein [Littorina saxatilis]|uniref:uncharacterized protein isoform X4 n=1 Tax=Littorina saxatilis TaxID=31220 RepID=UPI0038B41A31
MQCRFFFVFAVALLSVRSLAVLAKGKDDKETEKLHMKVTSMSDDIKQIQATDGTRYLLTVYQISTTDVNCYTDKHTNVAMAGERNESAVDADISSIISGLLNDSDAVSKEVDTGKVMKLFLDCSNSPKDAVQTLANLTNTPAPPHHRVAMKKRAWWSSGWAIYPGTKWCGSGGSAINYDDLECYPRPPERSGADSRFHLLQVARHQVLYSQRQRESRHAVIEIRHNVEKRHSPNASFGDRFAEFGG